jgi:hypothetical protein
MDTRFFSPIDDLSQSEGLMKDYQAWLTVRNGSHFEAREARMRTEFDATRTPTVLTVDGARLNRNYEAFRERAVGPDELALLAFVKMNAGEAWGVECVSKARARQREVPGVVTEVERVITTEETFHTRLLVGVAGHFHDVDGKRLGITGVWRPPAPLRLLIGGLVWAPKTVFHPLLLASEVAGVFLFDWVLRRLSTLFPGTPSVRESMAARLTEVLIDEVGHITFNRLLVGAAGRAVAKALTPRVAWMTRLMTPELAALGLGRSDVERLSSFDFDSLPAEVKRRAFFA